MRSSIFPSYQPQTLYQTRRPLHLQQRHPPSLLWHSPHQTLALSTLLHSYTGMGALTPTAQYTNHCTEHTSSRPSSTHNAYDPSAAHRRLLLAHHLLASLPLRTDAANAHDSPPSTAMHFTRPSDTRPTRNSNSGSESLHPVSLQNCAA